MSISKKLKRGVKSVKDSIKETAKGVAKGDIKTLATLTASYLSGGSSDLLLSNNAMFTSGRKKVYDSPVQAQKEAKKEAKLQNALQQAEIEKQKANALEERKFKIDTLRQKLGGNQRGTLGSNSKGVKARLG